MLTCIGGVWRPGGGDPDLMAWVTVALLAGCAVLAIAVLRMWPRPATRGFWIAIAVVTAVLAVNKQLDLQTVLTATGRCMARAQGWYEHRRAVQTAVITVLCAGVVLGAVWAGISVRRHLAQNAAALIGLLMLAAFVVARATAFHRMDGSIGAAMTDTHYRMLELIGAALIALNAAFMLRRRRR
ncbi:hypothetical protein [Paracoccus sp. (in: a-proteobacteria)]|uniref:hypothetical protein n=1 Tax=Paracoccus sp. TaxID=267 RepID=UPI0026DF9C71|nr:hypothetical protein [Paracoccus sp. (in: a-proteobacteria)]MDO5648666.1 hypothetical protein [Paracoccus sp. (in: a-proteobacteria)]